MSPRDLERVQRQATYVLESGDYWLRIDRVAERPPELALVVWEQEFLVGPFESLEEAIAAWRQKEKKDDEDSDQRAQTR